MKLATVKLDDRQIVGAVDSTGRSIRLVQEPAVGSLLDIIRQSEGKPPKLRLGEPLSISDVQLCAPIPRPARNIFCVGKNYHEHAHEFTRSGHDSSARGPGEAIPTAPIFFSKVPETVIGDGARIRHPGQVSDCLDYEAELGVVIGKSGRGIPKERAYEYVWGYTVINDVTARDLQSRHKQWLVGKSLDTFCPMGPWLVSADEVDAENLDVRCWVNEELRQSANTSELIFDIPTLIATLSAGITLYAGDIIATGTPAGVGIGSDPPRYLQRGDSIRIEITGLGQLTNAVE
jgi:2-keto-4-pentenoate hydratase/2-oxohepta-3-ene-1,7-dioic acid hydratase in catechol pathway